MGVTRGSLKAGGPALPRPTKSATARQRVGHRARVRAREGTPTADAVSSYSGSLTEGRKIALNSQTSATTGGLL